MSGSNRSPVTIEKYDNNIRDTVRNNVDIGIERYTKILCRPHMEKSSYSAVRGSFDFWS